jgi:hypothetical protein
MNNTWKMHNYILLVCHHKKMFDNPNVQQGKVLEKPAILKLT